MIEQLTQNPTILYSVIAVSSMALGIVLYKNLFEENGKDKIDTESFEERIKAIFKEPVDSNGSKIGSYMKQKGTSNTPQLIGYAVKAKEHDINVQRYNQDKEEFETEKVSGTTYTVIEGNSELDIKISKFFASLIPNNNILETHDIPSNLITTGDDYIWLDPDYHPVKMNGVKRHLSPEGMGRVWDSSFAGLHENYLETFQGIPESYAVLNNRVSGQLHIQNQKTENIKDYQKQKQRSEKNLQ